MKLIGNAPPGCHVLHDALSHGERQILPGNEHDAMQIIIPLDAVFELSDITFRRYVHRFDSDRSPIRERLHVAHGCSIALGTDHDNTCWEDIW